MDEEVDRLNALSNRVIGCALTVSCALGSGFWRRFTRTHWRTNCARSVSPWLNSMGRR